jgi:hypothetical protein
MQKENKVHKLFIHIASRRLIEIVLRKPTKKKSYSSMNNINQLEGKSSSTKKQTHKYYINIKEQNVQFCKNEVYNISVRIRQIKEKQQKKITSNIKMIYENV